MAEIPATEAITTKHAAVARVVELDEVSAETLHTRLAELEARLPPSGLMDWLRGGIAALERHPEAGRAFFAGESVSSIEALSELEPRAYFQDRERVLGLFCVGIGGRRVPLASTEELDIELSASLGRRPLTDGSTLFLPPYVDCFGDATSNAHVYRLAVLHLLEVFLSGTLDQPGSAREPETLAKFFGSFARPTVARQLFQIVEGHRVDSALARRYRGAGRLQRHLLQRLLLEVKATTAEAPLRQLDHLSLLHLARAEANPPSTARWLDASEQLTELGQEGATTGSSREATRALWPLVAATGEPALTSLAPWRGDLPVELLEDQRRFIQIVQDSAPGDEDSEESRDPIPNDGLGVLSLQDGDLSKISGLLLHELDDGDVPAPEDLESANPPQLETTQEELDELRSRIEEQTPARKHPGGFLYDEWDFEIGDYRRSWCRLSETTLEPDASDAGDFVEETLERHAELLLAVRRQLELLKPEHRRRLRGLLDGEDLDLDAVIERQADLKAGGSPSERVYVHRNLRARDVAAAFLLDMSASTDAELPSEDEEEEQASTAPDEDDDWLWPAMPEPRKPGRRVIDVEKEALVLMSEALTSLGDQHAVYGFSGYGRDDVDFFVAKEFDASSSRATQERIAAMKPCRSTRMGPAIRHTLRKLRSLDAKIKVLIILSDGYPQDYDYGRDRADRTYGIQDTMMALREAQLEGVQPFCITVDPAGQDYLGDMLPKQRYLVIEDVNALPEQLPKVYRTLTS